MSFIAGALRLCGAVVTAAVFFAGMAGTPALASDDLPIIGDIPMPEVHVSVTMDDDIGPPPPRPRFAYPRGPFAAMPPARFAPPLADGPAVPQLQVARMLHSTGYSLLGQINRRGWVYTVSVINPRGDDGRAIVDARTGAIIRFIPASAVNARLDDELGVIYGPPGPPPVAQDFSRTPRPLKPVPQADKGKSAPKLADRMPVNSQPSATSSIPSKVEPAKSEAAKSSIPAGTTTGVASNTTAPLAQTPPSTEHAPAGPKLWPTQAMPDVQPLD